MLCAAVCHAERSRSIPRNHPSCIKTMSSRDDMGTHNTQHCVITHFLLQRNSSSRVKPGMTHFLEHSLLVMLSGVEACFPIAIGSGLSIKKVRRKRRTFYHKYCLKYYPGIRAIYLLISAICSTTCLLVGLQAFAFAKYIFAPRKSRRFMAIADN